MSVRHIYPLNDLRPHDTESAGQCECEPKVEFLENGDSLVIHKAWDGREIIERLEQPSQQPIEDRELECSHCHSKGMGRVNDAAMEKFGWRKVDGKWVCAFCTGIAWNQINKAAEDGTIEFGEREP